MIPLATLGDWTAIGTVTFLVGGLTMWVQNLRQRDAYKDLEDRIRRPFVWAMRHPVQAIRRRSR